MRRRLFERLQQRIEGLIGELMRLIDDVNLETIARGPVAEILDDGARVVDLAIGRAVDFDNVERARRRESRCTRRIRRMARASDPARN